MYSVAWAPAAKAVVEAMWQGANDRDAVLLAMWAIEASLRDEPGNAGESRPEDQRITFASPLGVLFEVDEGLYSVVITSVWAIRRV